MSVTKPVKACGVLLRHLPVEHWPPQDIVAFEAAFAKVDDPFDPQGAGAHLGESTVFALRHAYRRWLGHLMLLDPEALALPPAQRVTPDRVRSLVVALRRSNTENSVATIMDKICTAIRYMAPDQDWNWFRTMSKALLRVARPQPKPVVPFNSARLQDVGLKLMEEADQAAKPFIATGKPIPTRVAIRHRDGLIIALLALLPLRRRNITMLELDSSLLHVGTVWHICLAGSDTKNGDDIEAVLPPDIGAALERHLAIYRPIFRNFRNTGATKALWLSRNGRPLSKVQLCAAFKKAVKAATGVDISLHDTRDIAATTIAIARPHDVSVASDLLGHRDRKTTERFYILARGTEASRVMSTTIANLRKRRDKNDKSRV